MADKMVKISANIPEALLNDLREYAQERNITVTEALRRAIRMQEYLYEEAKKNHRIIIEDDGAARQLVML